MRSLFILFYSFINQQRKYITVETLVGVDLLREEKRPLVTKKGSQKDTRK